jgi:hypothetical protein
MWEDILCSLEIKAEKSKQIYVYRQQNVEQNHDTRIFNKSSENMIEVQILLNDKTKIKDTFMRKLRADYIREMFATIQLRINYNCNCRSV